MDIKKQCGWEEKLIINFMSPIGNNVNMPLATAHNHDVCTSFTVLTTNTHLLYDYKSAKVLLKKLKRDIAHSQEMSIFPLFSYP